MMAANGIYIKQKNPKKPKEKYQGIITTRAIRFQW